MKSILNFISIILILVLGISCNPQQKTAKKTISKTDNSMTSIDWDGTYQGILPCADCDGIQTQLKLNKDLSYLLETKYVGKDEKVFQTKGTFKWDKSGSKITIDGKNRQQYQVGENKIFHLDNKRKRITGDLANKYILEKTNMEITGKYWKLIWLNGQTIKSENREPFIKFDNEHKTATGNSSCNSFHGTYELEGNKINFSPFAMTKMACIGNNTEGEFMRIIDITKSYSITLDGLTFKDEKENILAKFEADFFK